MREIRLNSEKEHERFLNAMELRMSRQGINNEQLAEALGVAKQSIYNFRTDRSRKPSKFLCAKIATYLEIRPYEWR